MGKGTGVHLLGVVVLLRAVVVCCISLATFGSAHVFVHF